MDPVRNAHPLQLLVYRRRGREFDVVDNILLTTMPDEGGWREVTENDREGVEPRRMSRFQDRVVLRIDCERKVGRRKDDNNQARRG